jgi:hypothetical protein
MRAQTVIVCIFLAVVVGVMVYAIVLGIWWW